MKVRFKQYRISKGAKALCNSLRERGLDALRLKVSGSAYRGHPSHLIINWGSSDRGTIRDGIEMLNDPEAVAAASDKVEAFRRMDTVPTPAWTTSQSEAISWVQEGYTVYCRTLTRAREGKGIVVAHNESEVVSAPLYTRGVECNREVRVHVFDGQVIDFSQKKKMNSERREEEGIELNNEVRNLNGGWIFARSEVSLPDDCEDIAVRAIRALGLDFGAVDIVITPQEACRVLEVNTAPGLQGTTLERYADAIMRKVTGNN